jgi:hypothetical protein
MITPAILTWMVERYRIVTDWVRCLSFDILMVITPLASQCKIL